MALRGGKPMPILPRNNLLGTNANAAYLSVIVDGGNINTKRNAMEVVLTSNEIATIRVLSSMRVIANDAAREFITDYKVSKTLTDEDMNFFGMVSEYAFCKKYNLFFDLSSKPRSGSYDCLYKGKRIDIKTTNHIEGRLIAKVAKKNTDVDVFVLAKFHPAIRTVEFVGWCTASELYKEANIRDIGYGPTYVVENLNPMNEQGVEKR